jgi:hypothetical protein
MIPDSRKQVDPAPEKKADSCHQCRIIRTALACLVLGGGAGFVSEYLFHQRELTMAATFFAALLPLMRHYRPTS